jgi:hypothetical protein
LTRRTDIGHEFSRKRAASVVPLRCRIARNATLLAKARPDAARLDIADMNHVLKIAPADRAGQQDANANPSLPLAPGLGDAVAAFVRRVAR